ncbi:hypothetical protein Goshw_002505 [Gossypium schwendimanii]|uniref:Uncharacterized protein n=2 Tax=Gossypium TaxID=3633 RepID=A0A7J9M9L5_GOSSC|nr:hypothetical protein [Gossypium schwendimanii]
MQLVEDDDVETMITLHCSFDNVEPVELLAELAGVEPKLAAMNEICSGDENHVVLNVYDEPDSHNHPPSAKNKDSEMVFSIPFMQKVMYVMGEVLGTYFLIFAGCAAVVVNTNNDKVLTNPGIAIVWGLAVMVPFYISAQVAGSTMAAGTLRLLFNGPDDVFSGTTPQGSDLQAFVIEFIITFYLMFVVSGVATDNRAIGELAGLAIGSTVLLNVLIAGYELFP